MVKQGIAQNYFQQMTPFHDSMNGEFGFNKYNVLDMGPHLFKTSDAISQNGKGIYAKLWQGAIGVAAFNDKGRIGLFTLFSSVNDFDDLYKFINELNQNLTNPKYFHAVLFDYAAKEERVDKAIKMLKERKAKVERESRFSADYSGTDAVFGIRNVGGVFGIKKDLIRVVFGEKEMYDEALFENPRIRNYNLKGERL